MVYGEDVVEHVLDEGILHCDGTHERIVRLDALLAMSFHLYNELMSLEIGYGEVQSREGRTESFYQISKLKR